MPTHTNSAPVNPFCAKGNNLHVPTPLCPWQEESHENAFVPVDNTQGAFEEFCDFLSKCDVARHGLAVLASGNDGCGKSSLLHRCAHKAIIHFTEGAAKKALVVDRSSERLGAVIIPRKCEDALQGVLHALAEEEGFLPVDTIKILPQLPQQCDLVALRGVVEKWSKKLVYFKRTLIVIAPKIEFPEEMEAYLSVFQRGGIVLLMESDIEMVAKSAERSLAQNSVKPLKILTVGTLSVDDGWLYVERKMNVLKNSSGPAFCKTGVSQYMKSRSEKSQISVRELELVCMELFEEATRTSDPEIRYQHFADYYLKVSTLSK